MNFHPIIKMSKPKIFLPKDLLPLVPEIKFSDVKVNPITKRKVIYLSLNGEKIRFQAATDLDPLTAPFGLSEPFQGTENQNRRSLEFAVNNPDLLALLRALDDRCKEVGLGEKFENWFGTKDKKEVVEGRYKSLVREPSNGNASYLPTMHTKFKLADETGGPKAADKEGSADVPGKVWIRKEKETLLPSGETTIKKEYEEGRYTDIHKMSKHVPICELAYLWTTNVGWGPTLITSKTIVFAKAETGELEEFALSPEPTVPQVVTTPNVPASPIPNPIPDGM